jgi:hypothetical protein
LFSPKSVRVALVTILVERSGGTETCHTVERTLAGSSRGPASESHFWLAIICVFVFVSKSPFFRFHCHFCRGGFLFPCVAIFIRGAYCCYLLLPCSFSVESCSDCVPIVFRSCSDRVPIEHHRRLLLRS